MTTLIALGLGAIIIGAYVIAAFRHHKLTGKTTTALDEEKPGHPYRPALELVGHDPNCEACSWMDRVGRWQPPEIVLTSGIPEECLMLGYEVTREGLDDMAKSCGLVVLARE